jgi:hypothetical protein
MLLHDDDIVLIASIRVITSDHLSLIARILHKRSRAVSPLPRHLHPILAYLLIPELVVVHDGDH